ncbi:PBECR2 nuclease fold domain-containing protein [Erwiniaceae bacterium L1_54_6]|nr:PBECR2 nuclease fold domain-containing protein [Erwiniaceae bacterium L1_54_6]
MAKAVEGLQTFKDLDLKDLRNLYTDERNDLVDEIEAGRSLEEALELLEVHMGFRTAEMTEIVRTTPIGDIHILRDKLSHIVEKRVDARERYVKFALDTLVSPYEIWQTMYDDGMVRYMFIGTYKQKQQMLVVVAPWNDKVLWNFMHTEAKGLNKHRRGNLLYSR